MFRSGITGLACLAAMPALANPCLDAGASVALAFGIPPRPFVALALIESGGDPYAMHISGSSRFAHSRHEAVQIATDILESGGSLDVGCYQLHLPLHAHRLPSIDYFFIPEYSAYAAATFALELFAESGHWPTAFQHYHSRTPAIGHRYICRLAQTLTTTAGDDC